MSYLETPRLGFKGRMKADPSTVNNDRINYTADAPDPGWHGEGKHHCIFEGVEITSVTTENEVDMNNDPVIGVKIGTPPNPVPGKMVDIDPVRQRRTALYGMRIELNSQAGDSLLTADLAFAHLRDLWGERRRTQSRLFNYGGVFSCQLQNIQWNITEPFYNSALGRLYELSPDKLAFHFTLCGYQADPSHPEFTYCDIQGVIGPVLNSDIGCLGHCSKLIGLAPSNQSRTGYSATGSTIPFYLDRESETLVVDFSNAIPEDHDGNSAVSQISIGYIDGSQNFVAVKSFPYLNDQYQKTSGVERFSLSSSEQSIFEEETVVIDIGGNLYLDAQTGLNIQADQVAFRMEPNSETDITILVSDDSQPLSNAVIRVKPGPSDDPNCLSFPSNVVSGTNGQAVLSITAGRPENFPAFPNGSTQKIYLEVETNNSLIREEIDITILRGTAPIESPTWNDVRSIFESYHYLYPAMQYLNMHQHESFKDEAYRARLKAVMALKKDHPLHMPVTRDLSDEWLAVIFRWFELGAP